MPARTGAEFLDRLSRTRTQVEIQGETLIGGYPSPTTGEPVATSFLIPRTPEDLAKRGQAFKLWAEHTHGMLGRTGDYLNSALMALASAGTWFAQTDVKFADNITSYYQKVREEDLLCTHTLIPRKRTAPRPAASSKAAR